MYDGIMALAVGIGWMNGFHATVEPYDEVVEVETKPHAVGNCYLPPELVEMELSSRLVWVVTNGPNVACIYESRSVQFPEEMRSILYVQVELDVASLVDKVNVSARATESARTKLADTPSADAVGTAAEIAFLVGQDIGVTVWESDAEGCMKCKGVVFIDEETFAEVKVELGILGISDVEERVLSVGILLGICSTSNAIEQVAGCLNAKPNRVSVSSVVGSGRAKRFGIIDEMAAPVHNEQILVVVPKNGITVLGITEIHFTESVANPRHEDVVDVQEIEAVLQLPILSRPTITKYTRKHSAVELWPVL